MSKITVIGGSSVATPALAAALKTIYAGSAPAQPIELMLQGRTLDKLEPVRRATQQLAQGIDWLRVTHSTDMATALDGAAYVLIQIRAGGLAARAFDESFPIPMGMVGEETVGAGGFANAVRTIPECVRIAKQIEQYAPQATVFSFANPASPVAYAISQTTRLRMFSLCDAAITMTGQAAAALGCDPSELSNAYIGMHHFGFFTSLWRLGNDVLPEALAQSARIPGFDMDPELIQALGVFPSPYFKYFLDQERILTKQRGSPSTRAQQLIQLEGELLAQYARADTSTLGMRGAKWYDAIIAPVLRTFIDGTLGAFVINLVNNKTVDWLPADAIIETNCTVNGGLVAATPAAAISPDMRARVQLNNAYEQLVVAAVLERDERKALRALSMNPLIGTAQKAKAVLAKVWPDGGMN